MMPPIGTLNRRTVIASAGAVAGCASMPVGGHGSPSDRIVAGIAPVLFPDRRFSITDFGARHGAGHDSLPGLSAAIAACADAGGGRVVVPPGLWRMDGPINLRSGVELHAEAGAVVRFGTDPVFYPTVLTRWEGTEVFNHSPLIYTRGQQGVGLTGTGRFEGQGRDSWFNWRPQQREDQTRLRDMGRDGVPVRDRVFGLGHRLRPAFVQFYECRDVLIDGPTFADSPFWVIHPVYCDGYTARNVTIVSKHLNSDGIDPDSCTNVLIERCRFDVSDDCVAIKSGRDQDGWRVARPTSRVVVRDCEMNTDIAAAFAIGSEMSGGAHDIFVERLRVPHAEHALYFKANLDRGGTIQRIRMNDIVVERTETLVHFTTDYHSYRGGRFPPTYRDFEVSNVRCLEAQQALHIVGVETAPVEDVRLRDITVARATLPDDIRHTRRLSLDRVRINDRLVVAPA